MHIAALLIGDFQAICPELVARGFFKIVAPPYYAIYPRTGKDDICTYVREKDDLPQWCSDFIYYPRFQLEIVYRSGLGLPNKILDKEEFRILTSIIYRYGLIIDNLSTELSINPLIMEAFLSCTHYLTPKTMNIDVVRESLGADTVTYDVPNNTLIVTMAGEDTVIPLIDICARIYEEGLLTLINRLNWMTWQLYITTKNTALFRNAPITMYQLYLVFRQCEEKEIRVKPLKGLGSMEMVDSARTCMDPRNRRTITVTSAGDVPTIYRLLGDDSDPRKLLTQSGSGFTGLFGSV